VALFDRPASSRLVQLSSLPQTGWRADFDKPLIFAEFGADALAGFQANKLAFDVV
jgi:hypothetical protein